MSTCKLSTKCSEIIDFSQEIRPTIHRICKIFIFNCNSDKICLKKMKSCGNNIEKQHADHITKIYQTGKKEVSKTKNRQMNGKKCKWDFQCVRARRLYMHSVWYNCHIFFPSCHHDSPLVGFFFCLFHGVRNGWQFSFDFFFHFYFLTISPAFSLCQTFKPLSVCLALIFNTFATPQSAFFSHQNNSIDCWYRPIYAAIDMVFSKKERNIFIANLNFGGI